ncbi:NAD(P)-binding protein [Calocera cornea HHB12733]|uniref:NAD(P)-binding protein n=1 Tax=Calocera cornea HHB12733 TaxID=1353952 RepID=A0A165GY67_9BASI|nr:NAD(P)-binding protein [Calocera cornea HHB12733]
MTCTSARTWLDIAPSPTRIMSIPPLPANTSLKGLSFLITGATAGLGYSTALLALQLGASPVYITARNAAKGTKTLESLLADPVVKAKNPNAKVEIYDLDMARWESVLAFGDKFVKDREAKGERLDIAVLNAGIAGVTWEQAPTGNEMMVQVNHLSTALLSLLLLPLLEKSTTPEHTARLTIVSSGMHLQRWGKLKQCPPANVNYLQTLNDKSRFDGLQRYGVSKMLVIFFVRYLAARISPDKVIVNNVCPGVVKTSINDRMPLWTWPILWMMGRGSNTPENGARAYIYGAAVVGKESQGQWYSCSKLRAYSDFVLSKEGEKMQEKEWKETMEVLEKVRPGVSNVVS